MSNGQWPKGNQPNPWAQQDPDWRPTQFYEAAGRDPRAPFGQQAPPPDPEHFRPKGPSPRIWLAIVAAAVVVAAALLSLQFFVGVDPDDPTTAPTGPAAPAQPTATRTGNFRPFDGSVEGVFELTAVRWIEDGLEVDYRIEVDRLGEFRFFAYTNETRESFLPEHDPLVVATPDEPATGTLFFSLPKVDSTVVLAGASGQNAIQALPVKG